VLCHLVSCTLHPAVVLWLTVNWYKEPVGVFYLWYTSPILRVVELLILSVKEKLIFFLASLHWEQSEMSVSYWSTSLELVGSAVSVLLSDTSAGWMLAKTLVAEVEMTTLRESCHHSSSCSITGKLLIRWRLKKRARGRVVVDWQGPCACVGSVSTFHSCAAGAHGGLALAE